MNFEFSPAKIIALVILGIIIVGGFAGGVIYFFRQPENARQFRQDGCEDSLCSADQRSSGESAEPDAKEPVDRQNIMIGEVDAIDIELLYSFYAGYDSLSLTSDSDKEEIIRIAKEDLGLKYLKIPVNWGLIEKQKGQFDWTSNDKIASYIKKYGLSTIVFFQQSNTPAWAKKAPAIQCNSKRLSAITSDPAYYSAFVYEFAKRYKDSMSIKYIELENEPNACSLWPDTAKYLAEVDDAVYTKVKTAYPGINICSASFHQPLALGGLSLEKDHSYSKSFIEEYLANLKNADCFSWHDYGRQGFTQTDPSYEYASQYDLESNYKKVLEKYKFKDTPIIFTECGYAKQLAGDNIAAAHLAQGYILSHAKGVVSGRMCQGITPGIIGKRGGENYGIADVEKKEYYDGYYAFKMMRSIMTKYYKRAGHIKGELNDEKYWVEKFEDKDGNDLYVVFAPVLLDANGIFPKTMPESQTAAINIGAGKTAIIVDMKGDESSQSADSSGNVRLEVSMEPVYVKVK